MKKQLKSEEYLTKLISESNAMMKWIRRYSPEKKVDLPNRARKTIKKSRKKVWFLLTLCYLCGRVVEVSQIVVTEACRSHKANEVVRFHYLAPILWKTRNYVNLIAGECNGAHHPHKVKDQSDSGDRNQFIWRSLIEKQFLQKWMPQIKDLRLTPKSKGNSFPKKLADSVNKKNHRD